MITAVCYGEQDEIYCNYVLSQECRHASSMHKPFVTLMLAGAITTKTLSMKNIND